MLFDITLYISLIVFGIGMIYRVSCWFRCYVGMGQKDISTLDRILYAFRGFFEALFCGRFPAILKIFVRDILFQINILKDHEDRFVWIMHVLIFFGFVLLFLMHALESIVSASLFSEYQSTLNPFLFLRNLFGLMVLAGLVIAVIRRFVFAKDRLSTNAMDIYTIVILAVIIISGFLLEGVKISSYTAYQSMVEEYSGASDEEEFKALEAYWVKNYGVVSPRGMKSADAEILARGLELHQNDCAYCHSRPGWAFVSNSVSVGTRPVALWMDKAGLQTLFWHIHFLFCFIGLAYLPFSKLFHMFSTPINLLVAAATGEDEGEPANIATRQMLELAGCSHGGTCHMECPVRVKRQERIDEKPQFSPALDYIGKKSGEDLGTRKYSG